MTEEIFIQNRKILERETGDCYWKCSSCGKMTHNDHFEMISGLCNECL